LRNFLLLRNWYLLLDWVGWLWVELEWRLLLIYLGLRLQECVWWCWLWLIRTNRLERENWIGVRLGWERWTLFFSSLLLILLTKLIIGLLILLTNLKTSLLILKSRFEINLWCLILSLLLILHLIWLLLLLRLLLVLNILIWST
jgi:hypothetical protein